MDAKKVKTFIELAGGEIKERLDIRDEKTRKLGAQLLLSETLEYIIDGLGVIPEVNGTRITDANALAYHAEGEASPMEMIDGLSDVAYTMYWNALSFGVPLEEAFDEVCDNNLEKFVKLSPWEHGEGIIPKEKWDCNQDISWPVEVTSVISVKIEAEYYAVGKDENGKVRKPSSYQPVDLSCFVSKD